MSIAPVQSFPPEINEQPENADVRSNKAQTRPAATVAETVAQSVSGTPPKQESSGAKSTPVTYELPEDVVEVHEDPEIKDQVIIEYLDQSKNVVLQVPSNQELSVERGIAQEFQQAAKLRESQGTAAATSEGVKNHGD